MKEKFDPTQLEIVRFEAEDIIRTSDAGSSTGGEDGEDDF